MIAQKLDLGVKLVGRFDILGVVGSVSFLALVGDLNLL